MSNNALTLTNEDQCYFGASIRRFTESGEEYYDAREVAKFFGYRYGAFASIIRHVIMAWGTNGREPLQAHIRPVITITSKGDEVVYNYHFSRRGFLTLVMNSNPERPIVARGHCYIVAEALKSA